MNFETMCTLSQGTGQSNACGNQRWDMGSGPWVMQHSLVRVTSICQGSVPSPSHCSLQFALSPPVVTQGLCDTSGNQPQLS